MLVYRSNRVEALIGPLSSSLAVPLKDPFAKELVVVHSSGMGRWLSLRLAQEQGIAANLDFQYPGRVVQLAFSQVLGLTDDLSLWEPKQLIWSVLAGLDALMDQAPFDTLRGYVQDDPQGLKRFQLARRIAGVFDRYGVYRPEMLVRWSQGAEPQDWQSVLWRWLRERLDTPSLGELVQRFGDRMLTRSPNLGELPERLSVFGVTSLPPLYVRILSLLSRHMQVHLFLLNPSDQWWADISSKRQIQSLFAKVGAVDGDSEALQQALALEEGHPMLASLGRLGRDFQKIIEQHSYTEPAPELFVEPGQGCLLRALQSDILSLERRGQERPRYLLDPEDRSITVHACHGTMRQVQVLQDQLLHLFDTLPGLQPRDVVVQLPDVESWAPLIKAVFDRPQDEARYIPFKVADRALRRDNPVAQAALAMLQMVGGRAHASEVLDLLSYEPVRARFGLLTQDLELLTEWTAAAGIRWGWDAEHRAAVGQPGDAHNTWRFGLQRLLLGVAMRGEERSLWAGVLPYDEIEGSIAQQLGRFCHFVQSLERSLRALERPRVLSEWSTALQRLLQDMLHQDDDNAWQHLQLSQAMSDASTQAQAHGLERSLDRVLLIDHLRALFDESRPPSGFLGGKVLFCGMVPMRSIPYRVVCMLGMDEHAFPRVAQKLGFDWIERKPKLGDRSPREDDRYLFLESLLSARERLLITFAGVGVRDNKPLPPSVVVSELLEVLSEMCELKDPGTPEQPLKVVDLLLQTHPLQPFSPRNFTAPSFSYASDYMAGAARLKLPKRQLPPFFPTPLAAPEPTARLQLHELVSFFKGPIPYLLRGRLGIRLRETAIEVQDREPMTLDGLELDKIAQPLLGRSLEGETLEEAYLSVRAKGVLPLGSPGETLYSELHALLGPLAEKVSGYVDGGPLPSLPLDCALGSVRLQGSIGELYASGRLLYQYSRVSPAHMVALWVQHLALQMVQPQHSIIIGRPESGGGILAVHYKPVDQPEPLLERLIQLYQLGRSYPLLFFPRTSMAWTKAAIKAKGERDLQRALYPAGRAWRSYNGLFRRESGDGTEPYNQRVLGELSPWDTQGAVAVPDGHGFTDLARAILFPLRAHMGLLP